MRQMRSISGLSSDEPSLEDITAQRQGKWSKETICEEEYSRNRNQQQAGILTHDSLWERVQNYCWKNRVRRRWEWESHRIALDRMK